MRARRGPALRRAAQHGWSGGGADLGGRDRRDEGGVRAVCSARAMGAREAREWGEGGRCAAGRGATREKEEAVRRDDVL